MVLTVICAPRISEEGPESGKQTDPQKEANPMPQYMKDITDHTRAAVKALEQAAAVIEDSAEYIDPAHVFHRSSVATYNALLTCLLKLDGMEA